MGLLPFPWVVPSRPRTSNSSPVSFRSRANAWLAAICVMPMRAAARVTLRFGQQRVERHEEVQVERAKIHVVHGSHVPHPFDT
jgi:hypothetical protein